MLAASSACGNPITARGNCLAPSNTARGLALSLLAAALLLATTLPALAQSLSVVHSFSGTDGSSPTAALLLATDGNFYGTTITGGAHGFGTIYQLTPSGTLTTLHNFAGPSASQADGAYPAASLIQGADNALYSTTTSGGAHNAGIVYRITTSGTLTTLYTFSGLDGSNPYGPLLIGPDGNFYGSTTGGGTQFFGTAFQLTPAGKLTIMHNFAGQVGPNEKGGNDGGFPYGHLVYAGNGYYAGTTARGGTSSNVGVIFAVNLAGDIVEPILFDKSNGGDPFGGLTLGSDGNAYGVTASGGAPGPFGQLYKFNLHDPIDAGDFSMLESFVDDGQPYSAYDALLQASDGNFYGTSNSDTYYGDGTVFEYDPSSGAISVLISFSGANGSQPFSSLVQGPGGTIWGTASAGGAHGLGEIFKVTVPSLASAVSARRFSEVDAPVIGHPTPDPVHADPISLR